MEAEMKQDQKVTFDNGVVKGTGKIVGVATNSLPVIGRTYIVEPDQPIKNETYNYSHIAMQEIYIKKVEAEVKDEIWPEERRRENPHHYTNRLD